MVHTEVYRSFKQLLPMFAEQMVEYFPNGKNSIRVRNANHREYIFTIESPREWRFETIELFIKSMKKNNKKEI